MCTTAIKFRRADSVDKEEIQRISADAYVPAYMAILGTIPKPATEDYGPRIEKGQVWILEVEGEPTGKVTRQADGSFIMDAAMPMDEAAKVLKPKSLPPGDFVTLGGFVLSRLNRMPECGEHFTWEDWDFQVAEVNRSRIGHLLVRPRQ